MFRILAWIGGVLLVVVLVGALFVAKQFGAILVDLDDTPPELPADLSSPAVLIFSKTNGFVHKEALPVADAMLKSIADNNGWDYFQTENGAVMTKELLKQFDVVIWNNTSGTVLDENQKSAFRNYMESGGGFLGLHAAGGDFWYQWDWYVDTLIGAQFAGHTMQPQFVDADVLVPDPEVEMLAHLSSPWNIASEEWYFFKSNPRSTGSEILLTMDENSYDPGGTSMEGEHPIAWRHNIEQGRAVYIAIGHQAATYKLPAYVTLVEEAIDWAGMQ